uniref:Peptidoglycan-associated lipoprotein n=1 Tax=Chlorobium chlorochromatii (strain CaD3) TaxID=340177 RepID=Q3APB4_CHLCH
MKTRKYAFAAFALLALAGCSSKSSVAPAPSASSSAPQALATPLAEPVVPPPAIASEPLPMYTPPVTSQPLTPSATTTTLVPATVKGYGYDQWQKGPLGDIFFEYDSATLDESAQMQLQQNAALLQQFIVESIQIEGHCDIRGTSEYNLALGERRATTAKEYLMRLGVPASRLETVSFGEERPFDNGNSEDAWAKNRRVHFVLIKQ